MKQETRTVFFPAREQVGVELHEFLLEILGHLQQVTLLVHAAALLEMVLGDPPALAEQPRIPDLGAVKELPVLRR